MSRLDEALDAFDGDAPIEVERSGGRAVIEAAEVGPLGVRVTRVRVDRDQDWDIRDTAHALPDRLRTLSEPMEPIEVAPELGGAILRTSPECYRGGDYFEVEVKARGAEIRRVRVQEGRREPTDFTLTREQLGRLLDELEG